MTTARTFAPVRTLSLHFEDRRRRWVVTGRSPAGFRTLEVAATRDLVNGVDVLPDRADVALDAAGWPPVAAWVRGASRDGRPFWTPAP